GVDNVWLLLSVFSLQQAFFGLNQPARGALLPTIVPLELLPAANSLNMTVMTVGAVIGPVMGGALIPLFGYELLYSVDAVCLFATLYAVIRLPALVPKMQPDTRSGFKGIVDGFRYLRTNTVVMVSLLVDVIAMVFGMPRALFPQIAVDTFDGPDEGGIVFSLLFAALAGGSAVAGIFSGWVSRVERQGLAVITAIIVWGSAMVLFGLSLEVASSLWTLALITALFGLGLGGGADMISSALRSTMLQEAATDDTRGRMQGVFIVVVAGGPRLADILHGTIAEATGTTVAAAGGGFAVIVLVLGCSLAEDPGSRARGHGRPDAGRLHRRRGRRPAPGRLPPRHDRRGDSNHRRSRWRRVRSDRARPRMLAGLPRLPELPGRARAARAD